MVSSLLYLKQERTLIKHISYLKQFLQQCECTDAIIGGESVKLYRNLHAKLATTRGQVQASQIIIDLKLRRILVPTNEHAVHFYLVRERQQGVVVERALQQLILTQASVA